MITGCFRSDYVNTNDNLLSESIESLAATADAKHNFYVSQIELERLNTEETNSTKLHMIR